MLLYTPPDSQTSHVALLDKALSWANRKYDGNLKLRVAGYRGSAMSFRLVVNSSRRPGAKYARGRHVAAACWHAHRDLMVALFNLAPEAKLKTAVAYYKGRDDFNAKFEATGRKNVGSMMEPLAYRDACECAEKIHAESADGSKTTFGTLTPDGKLTNVRVIRQSDLLRCPHVILVADHYRPDGTCRCDDPTATEMKEWGYVFKDGRWRATLESNA